MIWWFTGECNIIFNNLAKQILMEFEHKDWLIEFLSGAFEVLFSVGYEEADDSLILPLSVPISKVRL